MNEEQQLREDMSNDNNNQMAADTDDLEKSDVFAKTVDLALD